MSLATDMLQAIEMLAGEVVELQEQQGCPEDRLDRIREVQDWAGQMSAQMIEREQSATPQTRRPAPPQRALGEFKKGKRP